MQALTVCQPWAWAIAEGFKLVENRSWATHYRGPLAIHAGLSRKWIDGGRTHLWEAAERFGRPAWRMPDEDSLVDGAIVAVVDVVDCLEISCLLAPVSRDSVSRSQETGGGLPPGVAAFAGGPWCWMLANVRKLATPIAYRGRQGLFTLDEATTAELATIMEPAA